MIYGFGTRPATNHVIRAFCESTESVYFKNAKNVDMYEISYWQDFNWHKWIEDKIPIVVLGILRGTEQLLWRSKENNINYYYIDHAYFFRAEKHIENKITNEKSYRICLNNENLNFLVNDKMTSEDTTRIRKNKNLLFPKNIIPTTGNKILICPPSFAIGRYYKFQNGVQHWLEETIKTVRAQTDKEIIIRFKDSKTPWIRDFENAYCIITYQSTLAIEAVLRGIPSYCDKSSSVAPVSNTSLNLNQPYTPTLIEIEKWVDGLLANQFTMQEIQKGVALNAVNRLQKQKYIVC